MSTIHTQQSQHQSSQQLTPKKTLELYKNTLNFNVIGRYDPKIKQLLFHTSHAVIYRFNDDEQWEKLEYQGGLALYLRDTSISTGGIDDLFIYGLILLNRAKPENFSLGIVPTKISAQNGLIEMGLEKNNDLLIVKNNFNEIYGLWIFDEVHRERLYQLIEFCINNEPL